MNEDVRFRKVLQELNSKSPSMCLAKWLQVTVHLQNGMTHSCHHPPVHKIPLDEVQSNPSALHNTSHKKTQRKKMLDGVRPEECDYCWRVEDSSADSLSDRTYKSADHWAYPHFGEVVGKQWDDNITPTYVEVSFGNECNFKCAYCSPVVSSGILAEFHKFGAYKEQSYLSIESLKDSNQYPYSKNDHNPYVEAFWNWWPELSQKLEVFRITGGEPLLNPNTFKFLDKVLATPMPDLDLAINSNLSVPDSYLNNFIEKAQKIQANKSVKKFEIYTSVDTHGEQAEYVRHGMNYTKLLDNMKLVLDSLPDVNLVIMCTYNIFSVPRFTKFLEDVRQLKVQYRGEKSSSRIQLSISYLRHPEYMAANIITPDLIPFIEESLDYMLRNAFLKDEYYQVFSEFEIDHLRRILEWVRNDETKIEKNNNLRAVFYQFFHEYDKRKGTSLHGTFPEYNSFFSEIEKALLDVSE